MHTLALVRRMPRTDGPRILRGAILAAVLVSAVVPLALVTVASLAAEWRWPDLVPARWTLESWRDLLEASGRLSEALLFSTGLGIGTGVLGTALALPVGRALARLRGWRRHLGAGVVFLPVAAPPVALGTGLQLTFLTAGLAGTFAGVLLAHLIPTVGYLSLLFLGVFAVWDPRAEEEARTLGASPFQVLTRVTLPMLRPALAASAALGFLISWAQVPLTLLIGRGIVPTLPVEVFAYLQAGQDRIASTGALLLMVPPLLALGAARLAARDTDIVPV